MSTPLSPKSMLRGPALYAPPHVRERAVSTDQGDEPVEQYEQPDSGPYDRQADEEYHQEHEQIAVEAPPAAEDTDDESAAQDADALDWVDRALRALVDLEYAIGDSAAPEPESANVRSQNAAPARAEPEERPRPSAAFRANSERIVRAAPPRRHRLDPEILPEPPAPDRRNSVFPLLTRLSLVLVFAAIVAYGLATFSSSYPGLPWLKAAGHRLAELPAPSQVAGPPAAASRLVVENQNAFANEPLSLAVTVEHPRDNESLLLDGLVQGTTLSAGVRMTPTSWSLPYGKLRGLYLYAPKDFIGVMNAAVDLLSVNKRLLDSRAMQLKWIARQAKTPSPPMVASLGQTAIGHIDVARPVEPKIDPIAPSEAAMLMQRGRDSLSTGDISAARVIFRRLAEAGIADAALALANTYDSNYLAAHDVVGVEGDNAMARTWYERAKELGSAKASRILAK